MKLQNRDSNHQDFSKILPKQNGKTAVSLTEQGQKAARHRKYHH
jgi:hypothetical protein